MGYTSDITVRSLTRTDESHWRRLWSAYLRFYGTEVAEEVYATTFSRLLDPNEPQWGLMADRNGAPVGLVHYIFHRHNWRIEDACYLQDLYADAAARGCGVGRALIEAVYAAADAQGAPGVYWLTQELNHEARRLYDRVGEPTPFIKYQRGQIQ